MISGMTGNKKLAVDSNVIFGDDNSNRKRDVYERVLPKLREIIPKLNRDDVKKQVMTTPYGVTTYGMIKKFEESGFSKSDSIEATKCISKVLNEMYPDINDLMLLLRSFFVLSLLFDEYDLVFEIDGLRIPFVVYVVDKKKVTISGNRVIMKSKTASIDFKKTCNSLTANLTHAYDSYFLSTLYFNSLDVDRKVVLSSIHDSFGSNFLDMDIVNYGAIKAFKLIFINSKSFINQIDFKIRDKFSISKEDEGLVKSIINGRKDLLVYKPSDKNFKNIIGWGKENLNFLDEKNREVVFTVDVKKLSEIELLMLKYYFINKSKEITKKFLKNKSDMFNWEFKKIVY